MSTSSSSDLGFKKLGETNWNSWSADMKAKLMEKKVYGVVSGKVTAATPGVDAYSLYIMQEQAAGIMWSGLEESNKSIVKCWRLCAVACSQCFVPFFRYLLWYYLAFSVYACITLFYFASPS